MAIPAAVVSFLLALDIRSFVVETYLTVKMGQTARSGGRTGLMPDGSGSSTMPWALSFVNAVAIILLMALWIVYIFYVQHHFEKKCDTRAKYVSASLKFLLPVLALFAASQIFYSIVA